MIRGFGRFGELRGTGIACALAATGLGIVYLIAAGAPVRYPVVNAAAFLLGIVALRGLDRAGRPGGGALLALGACLLATALFGASADGASRWIWVGPLSVQVSLVVLPVMAVAFARSPGPLGAAGIAVAALALALQPDRAMAAALAFAMAALVAARPGRPQVAALLAAVAAFAASLARPDALPAVPYVDRILFTAFDVHVLAGSAVLLGVLLLPIPAIVGGRGGAGEIPARRVFGALWLGCVLAALFGNYPTPVVGYGGSAIFGYLLSLAPFPAGRRGAEALDVAAEEAPARAEPLPKRAIAA